jgi:DnaJ-class molecular chaperone
MHFFELKTWCLFCFFDVFVKFQPTNPTVARRSNLTPSLVTGETKGSSILPLLLIFGIFAYVFNEISSGFFNTSSSHDVHAANQIKLIQTSFDVPLQLIFDGGYADVPLPEGKQVICSLCSGSGAAPGHSTSCPYCQV